ncbi:MAG: DapH/DapD/GlmU-related protein [Candidatus Ancaeobacter aquaticus]|nr:DapH/DapD/GlmU-related protein [Candidatus Ancaeobacter aquaticus]
MRERYICYDNVTIGANKQIEPYAIIGQIGKNGNDRECLVIGDNVYIGSRVTICKGVTIGNNVELRDGVFIARKNLIGNNCRFGPKTVIEYGNKIGDRVRIHSHSFVERVIIESDVFIGPHVVFTDDIHPACPRYEECSCETHIESYVSIGANVTIVPGIRIGTHSQIFAGAVVTKDVEAFSVIAGNPAKKIKDIKDLKCHKGFFERPFMWWGDHERYKEKK